MNVWRERGLERGGSAEEGCKARAQMRKGRGGKHTAVVDNARCPNTSCPVKEGSQAWGMEYHSPHSVGIALLPGHVFQEISEGEESAPDLLKGWT